MKSPICRITSVGEISSWARQFLKGLHNESVAEVAFEGSTAKFCESSSTTVTIVFIENGPDMKREIQKIRTSGRPALLIWFGKAFTKEDLQFALENRIYMTLESPRHDDKKLIEPMKKIARAAETMQQINHYGLAIKTLALEGEPFDDAKTLFEDIKESAEKLDRCVHISMEFLRDSKIKVGADPEQVTLRANQEFRDALFTINELERTGTLQIKGSFDGQLGRVQFLNGRLVSASAGSVRGLKALYRIFLWDEPRYSFERSETHPISFEEELNINLKQLALQGEDFRLRYSHIRKELPPKEIQIELEPSALHPPLELEADEFLVLGSVVEFGEVGKVVDLNPLPDVTIYEAMIALRKAKIIRVVSA